MDIKISAGFLTILLLVISCKDRNESATLLGNNENTLNITYKKTSTDEAPEPRKLPTGVWTGSQIIVWGGDPKGFQNRPLATGGIYSPATDTWKSISTNGAPIDKSSPMSVWTGDKMLVFGGSDLGYQRVSLYDPVTDSWQKLADGPKYANGSTNELAIWTGDSIIYWGGKTLFTDTPETKCHHIYSFVKNTWRTISLKNAPPPSESASAVWTGKEMIVWGAGADGDAVGGIYNPITDTWRSMSKVGQPGNRLGRTATFVNGRMLIWSGPKYDYIKGERTPVKNYLQGAMYDPLSDSWEPIPEPALANNPPETQLGAVMGNKVLFLGDGSHFDASTGTIYDTDKKRWFPYDTGLSPRENSLFVATSNKSVFIWGGCFVEKNDACRGALNDGMQISFGE